MHTQLCNYQPSISSILCVNMFAQMTKENCLSDDKSVCILYLYQIRIIFYIYFLHAHSIGKLCMDVCVKGYKYIFFGVMLPENLADTAHIYAHAQTGLTLSRRNERKKNNQNKQASIRT